MSSKRGAPRKAGKRAARIKTYYLLHYPRNKLRRILRHNGLSAARAWAAAKGQETVLKGLLAQKVKVRDA